MNILKEAFGEVFYLSDVIKNCIVIDDSNSRFLDEFGGVVIFIDSAKIPNRDIDLRCVETWSDFKNSFSVSPLCFGLNVTKITNATIENCLISKNYLCSTNLLHLLDCNVIWEKLYQLIGTKFMKLIIFDSVLFLPVSENSLVALHEDRALRTLNKIARPYFFRNKNLKSRITKLKCFNKCVEKDVLNSNTIKNSNEKTKSRRKTSRQGFNGSILLDLHGIMYNKTAKKYKRNNTFCNCTTVNAEKCKYLLQIILEQNVGLDKEYMNSDLSKFENLVKGFIYKNLESKTCFKIIKTVLKVPCSECQTDRKRKLSFEDERDFKKLKYSDCIPITEAISCNTKSDKLMFHNEQTELKRKNRKYSQKNRNHVRTLSSVTLKSIRKYITSILRKTLPSNSFGSQRNVIIKNILHILKYGKFQVFELRDLLKNIDIKCVLFLKDINRIDLKWNLLAKFLLWLVNDYIFLILAERFYITETGKSFNKLHYYKMKDWQVLKHCVVNNFVKKSKRWKVANKQIKESLIYLNKTACYVRFIPKGKFSVRPIISGKRKSKLLKQAQIFLSQFCVLNRESRKLKDLNDFHKSWLTVCNRWKTNKPEKLYFVKVDILDAYGSVLHNLFLKLFYRDLVEKMVYEDDCQSSDKKRKKKLLKLLNLRTLKYFKKLNRVTYRSLKRFDELPCNAPFNSVIVPTKTTETVKLRHLFLIIKKEVQFKDVFCTSKRCLIVKGIAQGSPLSSAICQLYYDKLDSVHLKEFINEEDFFIRAVDDYLYVTKSLDKAKKFLSKMEQGFADDFGVVINKKKTVTNFGKDVTNFVPFYGHIIDTVTMELFGNYNCYKGINIFHTLSFKTRNKLGEFLKNRICNLGTLKLHNILLDPLINTKKTVLMNILKASVLMAFRFHAIVANLFKTYNSNFFIECIEAYARIVAARVDRITKSKNLSEQSVVKRNMVLWVVYKAFYLKLEKELKVIEEYQPVLTHLKHNFIILFSSLMNEDQDLLRNISKYRIENDFKGTQ